MTDNAKAPAVQIRLDIGCGKNKRDGFTGMDHRQFPGVDIVHDITITPWPLEDGSVSEVNCSHFLEHLTGVQRVGFFNELYRVMAPGAKAAIITPHWASERAYGDFTHAWPPVSEMLFYYLARAWRKDNAPDNDIEWNPLGYSCNFEATWGHALRGDLLTKHQEHQIFALTNFKGAATDLIATLTKS